MSAPSTDRGAVQQIIRAIRASGWLPIAVDNGEERVPVTNETEAIEAIFEVDAARLVFAEGTPTGPRGWVLFVLGNEPFEVAADWTTNLPAIGPLTESWW